MAAATRQLAESCEPLSSRLDSELLAGFALGKSRADLIAHADDFINKEEVAMLADLLARRLNGEPIAYLRGEQEFWSMQLKVSPDVLIPRADTETLVEAVLTATADLPDGVWIELGTGSGAIALALASECPGQSIIAVEQSSAAIRIARDNLKRFKPAKLSLLQASWLDAFDDDTAAAIVANPPYLAVDDPHLAALRFEPAEALIAADNGLGCIRDILDQSRRVGRCGALVLLEHGCKQAEAVRQLFYRYQYTSIHTETDLAGRDRISYGYISDQTKSSLRHA